MKLGLRTGLAFIALLAVAPAQAADLGMRVQPPALAPAYNWSGFYAGLNAGGAWGHSNTGTATVYDPPADYFASATNTALFNAAGVQRGNASGFTGGGQVGFNWQAGNTVLGLETDFQSFRLNSRSTATGLFPAVLAPAIPFTISHSTSTDWLWTLRPRVGFAANNWLFYATGGVAVANVKASWQYTDSLANTESASLSKTKVGWTVGGGVEYALSQAWSVKAEYLYVDLGDEQITTHNLLNAGVIPIPGQPFFHSVSLKSNIVRAGLNYKFGTP
jgi:outer membrane immunogenic protein